VQADAESPRERGVAVHEERRARPLKALEEAASKGSDLDLREVTLAQLDETDAAGDRRGHHVDQISAARFVTVGDQHQARQPRRRPPGGGTQRPGSRPAWIRPAQGLDASA